MSDHTEGYGPSYWDVERTFATLRAEYPGTWWVEVSAAKVQAEDKYRWSVRACYQRPGAKLGAAPRGHTHPFRGPGGSKTLPAAMHLALMGLYNALEDERRGAEAQASF